MNTTATATAPKTIAELIEDEYTPLWVGPSGEGVTGESVARHVEAASELLATDGWARSYNAAALTQAPEAPPADATLHTMVRWVIDVIRDESCAQPAPRTVDTAMHAVADTGAGDPDTASVGRRLMGIVLTARSGNHADVTAWVGRLGRTLPEVQQLLADTAAA